MEYSPVADALTVVTTSSASISGSSVEVGAVVVAIDEDVTLTAIIGATNFGLTVAMSTAFESIAAFLSLLPDKMAVGGFLAATGFASKFDRTAVGIASKFDKTAFGISELITAIAPVSDAFDFVIIVVFVVIFFIDVELVSAELADDDALDAEAAEVAMLPDADPSVSPMLLELAAELEEAADATSVDAAAAEEEAAW